jgi:glyoxylase-like metal-dependent hydrolase (beta-lactamase superfamily II)
LTKDEWEYWSAPDKLQERAFLQRTLPALQSEGVLQLANSEVEIAPGVRLVFAPGHTPGHTCVALTSGQEMAIYTGDLLHHCAQFEHPEWSPAFDLLPELSAASRAKVLERALRDRAVLLTAHLATPGIARPGPHGYGC